MLLEYLSVRDLRLKRNLIFSPHSKGVSRPTMVPIQHPIQ